MARCAVKDQHNTGTNGQLLWIAGKRVSDKYVRYEYVWKMPGYHGFKDVKMNFKGWRKTEPNWSSSKDACAAVWYAIPQQYGWSAQSCLSKYCFVCERRKLR